MTKKKTYPRLHQILFDGMTDLRGVHSCGTWRKKSNLCGLCVRVNPGKLLLINHLNINAIFFPTTLEFSYPVYLAFIRGHHNLAALIYCQPPPLHILLHHPVAIAGKSGFKRICRVVESGMQNTAVAATAMKRHIRLFFDHKDLC